MRKNGSIFRDMSLIRTCNTGMCQNVLLKPREIKLVDLSQFNSSKYEDNELYLSSEAKYIIKECINDIETLGCGCVFSKRQLFEVVKRLNDIIVTENDNIFYIKR